MSHAAYALRRSASFMPSPPFTTLVSALRQSTFSKTRLAYLLGVSTVIALGAGCSAPGTTESSASGTSPRDGRLGTSSAAGSTAFANDQTAFDYFRAKGFTTIQAAGIVGNLDQESGIDPNISQQNGGPGRGIAQWSAGGRWDSDPGDNLVAFAAQEGQPPNSLGVQLDFIMFELENFSDYGLAKLKATTTIEDATTEFELGFEGCGIPAQCDADSRLNYAKSILAAYANDPVATDAGTTADDAGTPSEAGEADDTGTTPPPPSSDSGTHAASDASTPPPATDSGTSGLPATSNDAPAMTSGCAIANTGTPTESSLGWLAALGLVACAACARKRS